MAEYDNDDTTNNSVKKGANPWLVPTSAVIIAPKTVLVEPNSKGYKILIILGNMFTLASLIAWFVLLVSLIFLVFSLVNSLETLNVMREQGAFLYSEYGHGLK